MVLSEIEQSIKRKVEAVGRPLREWDINIYRGILTGYNDAFIITTEKKEEILSNCKDDEEREKTSEIIRPILRGRDIKRYSYDWANLWLINTHNGVKGRIPRIDINDYPAVKTHLDQYWDKIKDRADQGDTPYNLRNCAYLDFLNLHKIVWKRVGSILRFSYDEHQFLTLDSTCFAVGKCIEYICCILNSSMGRYLLKDSPQTGTGDLLISVQAIEPLMLPPISDEDNNLFVSWLSQLMHIQDKTSLENTILNKIFDLYGLTSDEREFVRTNFG